MATVLLARHGETTWNRAGRIQGWAPVPLTDRGHEQARALGLHLDSTFDLDRVVASDLRRARETTDHVCRATGLDAEFEAGWRERDFGSLQGFTPDELVTEFPEYALSVSGHAAAEARPDSGESVLDVRDRVLDRWAGLLAALDADETVLVVAHGGPLYLLLGQLKGLDVVTSILDQTQGNCGLTELVVDGETADVVRENERSFL